jgi:electron transport complex protein RnfG
MSGHDSAQAGVKHTAAWRLIATLSVSGALAGFLIVFAFQWAQPRIVSYQEKVLNEAITEVLGAPRSVKPFPLGDERVFAGYDENNHLIGYAIVAAEPGFADVITLIFGYDASAKRILGMKVLDNKETPGLGDKIVKDTSFLAEFRDAATPLKGVKPGAGKDEAGEVDMITGATISSRAVIGIINRKLEKIEARLVEGARP